MVRRRGAVHGHGDIDDAVEVGLDELFRSGDEGMEDDADPGTEEGTWEDQAGRQTWHDAAWEDPAGRQTWHDAAWEDPADLRADDAVWQEHANLRTDEATWEQRGTRADQPADDRRRAEPQLPGATLGAAFFGWLVASSTAILLLGVFSVVCSLIGWSKVADWWASDGNTGRLLVGAWIVVVLSLGIGAFSGGYAGARMVPSHGGRQGLGVWLFGWCAVGLIAGGCYLANRKYDLVARIKWPTVPIAVADRAQAGLVALAAILLVTLVASVLGGAAAGQSGALYKQWPRGTTDRHG